MIKASRKIEYGLLALKWMTNKSKDQLTTAREICNRFNVPFDPLARALQLLHKGGVLDAIQGAQGGYRLRKDLSTVTFGDFARMIQGETPFVDCMGECNCDILHNCNIVSPMSLLSDKLNEFLNTIPLSDILTTTHKLHPIQAQHLSLISAPDGANISTPSDISTPDGAKDSSDGAKNAEINADGAK